MKFKLDGVQRDLVTSMAIHQDADGLNDFIEALVDEEVSKGAPAVEPPKPSELEQAVLKLVRDNA